MDVRQGGKQSLKNKSIINSPREVRYCSHEPSSYKRNNQKTLRICFAGYPFKFRTTNIYQLVKEIINKFSTTKKPCPKEKHFGKSHPWGIGPSKVRTLKGTIW